jgi:hypothetical protein
MIAPGNAQWPSINNLREDVGETANLSQHNPEKTQELLNRLKDWQQQIQAPIPGKPNPDYDPQAEAQAITAKLKGKNPRTKNRKRPQARNENAREDNLN